MSVSPRPDSSTHASFMVRALDLAALGLGRCSPNPPVGAVMVRDGQVVSEGFHRGPGTEHAEIVALRRAGPAAAGADVYITLEPCCHWGRTPGCSQALAAAGVRRILYAMDDPDPRICGRGTNTALAAGVEVLGGVLREQAERFYAAYIKHRRTGLPLVSAKMAVSLDGKVATRTGKSRWISGEQSRDLVHHWRDQSDAVMVGVGTVLADDPQLTCRLRDCFPRNPLRVIVDTHARTPVTARVLDKSSGGGCVIAAGEGAPTERLEALSRAGAEVWTLPLNVEGRVDLTALAKALGCSGIVSVLLEGGPGLLASALSVGLVDRLLVFYAPKVLGGADSRSMVAGSGVDDPSEGGGWRLGEVRRIGEDLLVEAWRCSPA